MYSLRIPFSLPPTRAISADGTPIDHGHLTCTLRWQDPYHLLEVAGFRSEAEAGAFLTRVDAAFAWLLLQQGLAAEVDLSPQRIDWEDDPEETGRSLSASLGRNSDGPVDAMIDGSRTAIFPTESRLRAVIGLAPNAVLTTPADIALATLLQGASFGGSENVPEDDKQIGRAHV